MPPPPRSCVACKNSKTKCDFDPRSGKKCTRCARIGLRCEQAVPIKQGRRTVGHVGASSVAAVGGHTIHSYIGGQPTCHISASQECAAALAAAAAHPPLMQHRAGGGGGAVGAIGAEVAVGAVCAEVADAPGGEIEQSIAFLRSFVLRPDGEGSPAPDSLVFMLRFNAAVARSRNSFDAMSGVLRACSALGVPLRHVLSMPAAGQGAAGPLELPGDAQAMLHCSAGYVHVRHLRDGTPHLRSNFAWESAILPMSETLASIESSASPCPLERALHPEDRPLALQLLVSIPLLAPGTEYSLQLPVPLRLYDRCYHDYRPCQLLSRMSLSPDGRSWTSSVELLPLPPSYALHAVPARVGPHPLGAHPPPGHPAVQYAHLPPPSQRASASLAGGAGTPAVGPLAASPVPPGLASAGVASSGVASEGVASAGVASEGALLMSDRMSEVASSVLEPWVGQSLSLDTLESCFDALSSEAIALVTLHGLEEGPVRPKFERVSRRLVDAWCDWFPGARDVVLEAEAGRPPGGGGSLLDDSASLAALADKLFSLVILPSIGDAAAHDLLDMATHGQARSRTRFNGRILAAKAVETSIAGCYLVHFSSEDAAADDDEAEDAAAAAAVEDAGAAAAAPAATAAAWGGPASEEASLALCASIPPSPPAPALPAPKPAGSKQGGGGGRPQRLSGDARLAARLKPAAFASLLALCVAAAGSEGPDPGLLLAAQVGETVGLRTHLLVRAHVGAFLHLFLFIGGNFAYLGSELPGPCKAPYPRALLTLKAFRVAAMTAVALSKAWSNAHLPLSFARLVEWLLPTLSAAIAVLGIAFACRRASPWAVARFVLCSEAAARVGILVASLLLSSDSHSSVPSVLPFSSGIRNGSCDVTAVESLLFWCPVLALGTRVWTVAESCAAALRLLTSLLTTDGLPATAIAKPCRTRPNAAARARSWNPIARFSSPSKIPDLALDFLPMDSDCMMARP